LDSSNPTVSFIVPHHGRDAMLLETIQSIASQRGEHDVETEVIVVTRDVDFNKRAMVSTLRDDGVTLSISVINIEQHRSISYARNRGAALANGQFLAFIDADIRLSENWLASMITLLEHPEIVLVSAVQIPDCERRTNDVIRSAMSSMKVGDDVDALPGANLFLRRDVFDRSEKFPEHLQTCEDSAFTNSLLAKGKLLLTDVTGFVHLGEDLTLASLFGKEIWRGKSNIDLLHDQKLTVSELPSVVAPLGVLAFLSLAVLSLLPGFPFHAMVFLSIAMLPGLLYALRLKLRSGTELGMHKLVTFYVVYFVARGCGMIQRLFERKSDVYAGAHPHE